MNVISLSPETYVNPINELKEQRKKNVNGFLSLKGILKSSDSKMSDKDLIDEYLKDKYGV